MRICILVSFLAAITLPAFAQHEYTESEIEAGKQQYAINCSRCHGPDGDNIANADIGRGKFRRASTDAALVALIRNGIPGTAMAAFPNMSEPNAQTIVVYLRSMASTAAAVAALPPGDMARGKTVFEGKGACGTCHRVADRGSRAGPDLSQIGTQRRVVEIHRSILEPDAEIIPANRFFRIVTKDGATFTGRLLNQDTFTMQILDAKDEKLKSFSKSSVREYGFASTSSMPSYKDKLSTQELSDLISYLTSLKGQAN
jgi:putative heme-binding domain-containing protein